MGIKMPPVVDRFAHLLDPRLIQAQAPAMFRPIVLWLGAVTGAVCLTQPPGQLRASEAPRAGISPIVDKSQRDRPAAMSPGVLESWRFIHTPSSNNSIGDEAIMHIADFEQSDARLAGLMLRCNKQGIQAIIVVIEPFSPQARPKIALQAGGQETYFDASVNTTGTGLIIPVDGLGLAMGPWRDAERLSVRITDGDVEIRGVVELAGLTAAIQSLADCAAK